MSDQPFESQAIAVSPEPGHDTDREIREQRAPPLRFARENIREMDFDERHPHREQRVAYGETRVRERGSIDQRTVRLPFETLNRVDKLAFVISLDPAAFHAERPRRLLRRALDLRQARAAIHLRLALTQEIQIRAVQHGDYDFSFLSHC